MHNLRPHPGAAATEPIYRSIARAIASDILRGRIQPGDRMKSEVALAAQYGVNRSTIREAIRMLEQDGLVRREPGKRLLRAAIPRSRDLSKPLSAAMMMQNVTHEHLLEAMYTFEPVAAEAAAARRTEDLLERIADNIRRTELALEDSSSLTDLDVEFHELIALAANNPALELARRPLGDLFYPAFYEVMSRLNAGPRLLFAHQAVFEAVRDQDTARARTWMQKHIKDFRRGFELANFDLTAPIRQGGQDASDTEIDMLPGPCPRLGHPGPGGTDC